MNFVDVLLEIAVDTAAAATSSKTAMGRRRATAVNAIAATGTDTDHRSDLRSSEDECDEDERSSIEETPPKKRRRTAAAAAVVVPTERMVWKEWMPDPSSPLFPQNLVGVLKLMDYIDAKAMPEKMIIEKAMEEEYQQKSQQQCQKQLQQQQLQHRPYSFEHELFRHPRHGHRAGIKTRSRLLTLEREGDVRLLWHPRGKAWSPETREDLVNFIEVLLEVAVAIAVAPVAP